MAPRKVKPKPKQKPPLEYHRKFPGIDFHDRRFAPGHLRTEYCRFGRLDIRTMIRRVLAADPIFEGFLLSNPFVEDNNNNEQWVPLKALGAGSCGKVAPWAKKNHLGEVVDTIAINQLGLDVNDPRYMWADVFSKEAFLQSQICKGDRDDSIVKLRRYRYYRHLQECRLYMEFASNGDLQTLRERYQAFDKYLPELFLWCVFEKLAAAAQIMQDYPKQWEPVFSSDRDQPGRNKFVLHCDIEPQNIFIFDYQQAIHRTRADFPTIPTVKLGDFGIADITEPTDPRNPDRFDGGTAGYMPPEAPPHQPLT